AHPDGYAYSRFCELYQQWRQHLDVVLRQEHQAGEKLFVDYAGVTIPIHDPQGGPVRPASIFVAVLGASNYTYAEATASQELENWIGSHIRTLEFLGGVPKLVIPDNTRTAVSRSCRYEPDLNRTYHELAMHYGVGVLPARPYKPRDKAKVENGVLVVERWIVAALRHRKFFSLAELNQVHRNAMRSVELSRAVAGLAPTLEPNAVFIDLSHARVDVAVADIRVPGHVPGHVGHLPEHPVHRRQRWLGMAQRLGALVRGFLFAPEDHRHAAFRGELDHHVRALVRGPNVVVLVDLYGVRERPGIKLVADLADKFAVG